MVLIIKGQTNQIPVTVSELSTSDSDEFRFVFLGDQKKKTYEVTLTDISEHPDRYNLFELEEGVDVTFRSAGDYEYRVYDSNDVLVEVRKCRVIEATEATRVAHRYPNENNIVHS